MDDLRMSFGPVVDRFVSATVTGQAREIACFGTRGDGKTIGALFSMLAHAEVHKRYGFPSPAKWIGVADTFESHKNKTFESLKKAFWGGCWKETDGGKIWFGGGLVELHLFGVKDNTEIDRVRTETVGVWFEEPAPAAVLVQSSGLNENAWTTALTSQRMPTHAKVAIMTLNYPDEDHWTAQRFVFKPQPGTMYFRVPPGERASPEDRAEWEQITANRPDMRRRLLQGRFGSIIQGPEVALGFNEDKHVSHERLKPIKGEPLFIGQDGGHTPCTIIGQAWRGRILVYAGLSIERGGMRQHYERNVMPWLTVNAPWAIKSDDMIQGTYDPAMPDDESDSDRNPIDVCRELLGGDWTPGPADWESRKGALITSINKHSGPGELALGIDPVDGKPLVQALSGRWYYPQDRLGGVSKDLPKKPNHPWEDLGDAFCYFLCGVMPELSKVPRPPLVTTSNFDPRQIQRQPIYSNTSFDPRRRAW